MIGNKEKKRLSNLKKILYKFYISVAHIINRVLFPPAKIMFVFWTLCWTVGFSNSENVADFSFIQKALVILFGYWLFCVSADVIYMDNKERYNNYKFKIYQKRYMRLERLKQLEKSDIPKSNISLNDIPQKDILNEDKPTMPEKHDQNKNESKVDNANIEDGLIRAKELENILNTTINQKDFASSLNELTNLLYDLSQKCDLDMRVNLREELNRIIKNRANYFDSFYRRRGHLNSIERIDGMSGLEFEEFCAKLLEKNGFIEVTVTKASGDHGIDILARKEDITYAIQCKCYSSDIGNAAVQQAHTGKSLYHKDIAVVMTNRYFTPQAIEEADSLGVKLWDRDKIKKLIGENLEDEFLSASKRKNFDLDAFAAQCNSYLNREDEMEQYK